MKTNKNSNSVGRYRIIFFGMIVVACYILGKAIRTMLPPVSDYWEAVDRRFVNANIPIEAHRGDLLSDDGRVLSTSLPEYRLYIDFRVQDRDSLMRAKTQEFRDTTFEQNVEAISKGLARIFPDYSADWFRLRLQHAKDRCMHKVNGRYPGPCRIYPRMATYDQYRKCCELPLFKAGRFKGGFFGEVVVKREKPYGSLAARTLGDLYPDSGKAKNGLELSYDTILRGTPGIKHRTKIRDRRVSLVDVEPEDGHDLKTPLT